MILPTDIRLPTDVIRQINKFLEGSDRLKVELCFRVKLETRSFYKLLIEWEHRDKTHVKDVTIKKGDMWWDEWDKRREITLQLTSRRCTDQVWTTVRWKYSNLSPPDYYSRKIITFMNMTTRGATRRVIKLLRDGRLNLWDDSGEINSYTTLRKYIHA
jgi:hypothetical protein